MPNPIGDAVQDSAGTKSFKVSLPDGTIVYHAVFDNGSNEAFVIHVQEIMNFCKRKGFYDGYGAALAQLRKTVIRKSTAQRNSKLKRMTQQQPRKSRKHSREAMC